MATKLTERALLVRLRISMYTGRKLDKSVVLEVCHAKQADRDAGTWWTHYIPAKKLLKVQQAKNRCEYWLIKNTMPWMGGSLRIIASEDVMEFCREMRKRINEYHIAVEDFVTNEYPRIRQAADHRLGELKRERLMPTAKEVRHKYGIKFDLLPLPSDTDLRLFSLMDDEVKDIEEAVKDSMAGMFEHTMQAMWHELYDLIAKMHDTFKQPNKKFRKATVENLKQFCQLIPKYNLGNHEGLEAMRQEALERLANLDAATIRANKYVRQGKANAAKELMDKMEAYKL